MIAACSPPDPANLFFSRTFQQTLSKSGTVSLLLHGSSLGLVASSSSAGALRQCSDEMIWALPPVEVWDRKFTLEGERAPHQSVAGWRVALVLSCGPLIWASWEQSLSVVDPPFYAESNPHCAFLTLLSFFFLLSGPCLPTRIADKAFYKQPNSDVIGLV